ncbi:MAG: phosphate acetyltransferase [Peptococcaceae bacterium]|jgi:phosphate acetyltransferase|nr:phosphate acetyltransferase [Peptococcaceae bacterium]
MNFIESIQEKARSNYQTIVLAEGTEERTVSAAAVIHQKKIARLILLGDEAEVQGAAKKQGADIAGITVVNPEKSPSFDAYAKTFYEMRKAKGMTEDGAVKQMKDPLYFGAMLVKQGEAVGMVAGARNATSNVLRAALTIIRTAPGISSVSGAFVIISPKKELGDSGIFVFADCAVTPNPTAEQVADFAYISAQTAKKLAGIDPRVAMLSFSTKGSASHELVDKMVTATKLVKENHPELEVDGELQLDAAVVPSVGLQKAPGSAVAGKANVLIFPDLQSGNIGYKLVQRFGDAEAIGPILQGMAKPVNDLSRGCSVEDIVNMAAITSCQS